MISVSSITPDCANLGLVKLVKYKRVTTGGFVEDSGSNRSLQKIQVVFFLIFVGHMDILGPLIPLFQTSGDWVSKPEWAALFELCRAYMIYIP